jgi:hypothetical protein
MPPMKGGATQARGGGVKPPLHEEGFIACDYGDGAVVLVAALARDDKEKELAHHTGNVQRWS